MHRWYVWVCYLQKLFDAMFRVRFGVLKDVAQRSQALTDDSQGSVISTFNIEN
jgi:hypothetical protein